MKKLILISLLTLGSSLFAADIGVRIQTPIGNNATLDIGFRSDDHRYDNRYRNFDYNRNGYRDDFGYFYGYFDRLGYFYNNIFFTYDSRYTYSDRLHHRGYFKHNHPHYREYRYHKNNDWNKTRNYREVNKPIYGAYYDRNYRQNTIVKKVFKEERKDRNSYNHRDYIERNQNQRNYKEQKDKQNKKDYRNNSSQQNQRNDKDHKQKIREEERNHR